MPHEIKIDGIGISPDVLTAIVSRAVSDVEGIASVGVKDLATNLVSMMLSSKAPASEPAVEAEVERICHPSVNAYKPQCHRYYI